MGLRICLSGAAIVATAFFAFATGARALTISAAPTANVTCTANSCKQDSGRAGVLNLTQLRTMLESSSVAVYGKLAIVVDAEITWASASTLTLDAPGYVSIRKPIAVTGTGGLALDTSQALALTFGPKGNVTFLSTSGKFAITLTEPATTVSYKLVNSIAMLASDIAAKRFGDYALANSYDASADGVYAASPIAAFGGNFIGLNNTISHLSITDPVAHHKVGLIGEYTNDQALLSWLRLTDANISGGTDSQVGGIVGVNRGTLIGDSVEGNVSTGRGTGGDGLGAVAGGLVGVSYRGVELSYTAGDVTGGRNAIIGGVVGENAQTQDGGGGGEATVYSTAAVSLNSGACNGCSAGKVWNSAGGVVGVNHGFVTASYATGAVTGGAFANLGGLIGYEDSTPSFMVSESYSTGAVTGGNGSLIGGAIGYDGEPGQISNFYWDTSTSGISDASRGAGNIPNDSGITGQTTTQLQSGLPEGFDNRIWGESAGINDGLPYLFLIAHD